MGEPLGANVVAYRRGSGSSGIPAPMNPDVLHPRKYYTLEDLRLMGSCFAENVVTMHPGPTWVVPASCEIGGSKKRRLNPPARPPKIFQRPGPIAMPKPKNYHDETNEMDVVSLASLSTRATDENAASSEQNPTSSSSSSSSSSSPSDSSDSNGDSDIEMKVEVIKRCMPASR